MQIVIFETNKKTNNQSEKKKTETKHQAETKQNLRPGTVEHRGQLSSEAPVINFACKFQVNPATADHCNNVVISNRHKTIEPTDAVRVVGVAN